MNNSVTKYIFQYVAPLTASLSFPTFVKFITINLLFYTYSCSKYFTLANVNILQIINNNSPSSQIIISFFDDQIKRKWHLQAKKEDWYLLDLHLLKNIFSNEECLTDSSIMVLIGWRDQNCSYSFRSSEIAFFDLSRNVVVEFNPITVVVVVSLTDESLFLYGFDGGQYNL